MSKFKSKDRKNNKKFMDFMEAVTRDRNIKIVQCEMEICDKLKFTFKQEDCNAIATLTSNTLFSVDDKIINVDVNNKLEILLFIVFSLERSPTKDIFYISFDYENKKKKSHYYTMTVG